MRRSYIKLKACPRCKGDILVDKAFEESEVCLQCGFRGGVIPAYLAHLMDWKETKRKYELKETDKLLLKSPQS
jgi:uncharacterized protein YbaR (Trm112 family)